MRKLTLIGVAMVAIAAAGFAALPASASSSSGSATAGEYAPVCHPAAVKGIAHCGAIQLLNPAANWHGVARAGSDAGQEARRRWREHDALGLLRGWPPRNRGRWARAVTGGPVRADQLPIGNAGSARGPRPCGVLEATKAVGRAQTGRAVPARCGVAQHVPARTVACLLYT